ncbi:MAG: hypothetical protein AUH18_00100 [Candidatus Rokubacteria bacterium 13_2_20CM_69_10]|nr:MAG: hypothetical protein AUH18_00100 [Candidatus Rokubacteria bacterium 13_2_20CM_69_10]
MAWRYLSVDSIAKMRVSSSSWSATLCAKARPPLLGMVGDHDRAQRGPVLAREHEDRGVPPLVLECDELLDERPVGHLDEELALVAVVGRQGGVERRRPVVADEAEAGLVLKGADAVPRAAEDGLHQGDGNAVLRVVKVHGPCPNASKTWAKSSRPCMSRCFAGFA